MKKLLLIFLLAMLSFQNTWAMAAVYCEHEKSPAAKHFGHHAHQHDTSKASKDAPSDKTSLADNDCVICHMSVQPSFLADMTLAIPSAANIFADRPPPLYDSHIPEGLQRPDWRALV